MAFPAEKIAALALALAAALTGCGARDPDYGPVRVCGASAAIVDGRLALEHERFATVKVGGCSGVLLAPRIAITAAHCHGTALSVTADDQTVTVLKRVSHPDYTGADWPNDLELLILAEDLPPPYATIGTPMIGAAVVSGYGLDENGNTGVLRIGDVYIDTVTQTAVLTGHSGADSCQGDSGGPIYQNGRLVAIVSHGRGSGDCGTGSVNVALDAFKSWIDAETGGAVNFELEDC